jgi:hypothetical protein
MSTAHKKTLRYLSPLVQHAQSEQIPHLILVGRNGRCARYMECMNYDLHAMILALCDKEPKFYEIIETIVVNKQSEMRVTGNG